MTSFFIKESFVMTYVKKAKNCQHWHEFEKRIQKGYMCYWIKEM